MSKVGLMHTLQKLLGTMKASRYDTMNELFARVDMMKINEFEHCLIIFCTNVFVHKVVCLCQRQMGFMNHRSGQDDERWAMGNWWAKLYEKMAKCGMFRNHSFLLEKCLLNGKIFWNKCQ
uniref:Uncharacterized protein n=1 Tax=Romanomermis culicivorax TaxID=13658 RepID=A0A915IT25_ROMCU